MGYPSQKAKKQRWHVESDSGQEREDSPATDPVITSFRFGFL